MNKLLLIVLSSCALQPIFAMEQSLALFHKRACVGNALVRPDGKMLENFSSSELEDAHPKVLDAIHSSFLKEIAFHSKFTGKFWLKKTDLTDEFWHNNSTLPRENVLDDYLIFLAKNGRCEIRKPNKNDVASLCAFNSAVHDRQHNWSYLKRLEPISVVAHNNEYAVQANDERDRESVLWDAFEADIREEEEGEWLEQLKIDNVNNDPVEQVLRRSDGIVFFPRWEWLEPLHVNNVNNVSSPTVAELMDELLESVLDEMPSHGSELSSYEINDPIKQVLRRSGSIVFIPLFTPFAEIEQPEPQSRGIYAWCTENPKKTIGLGIGTGVLGWLVYKYMREEAIKPVQRVMESVQKITQRIASSMPSIASSIPSVTSSIPSVASSIPSVTTALLQQAYDEVHSSLRQQLTRHKHSLMYCYNNGFLTNSFVTESALLQWIKDNAKMKKHWDFGK